MLTVEKSLLLLPGTIFGVFVCLSCNIKDTNEKSTMKKMLFEHFLHRKKKSKTFLVLKNIVNRVNNKKFLNWNTESCGGCYQVHLKLHLFFELTGNQGFSSKALTSMFVEDRFKMLFIAKYQNDFYINLWIVFQMVTRSSLLSR